MLLCLLYFNVYVLGPRKKRNWNALPLLSKLPESGVCLAWTAKYFLELVSSGAIIMSTIKSVIGHLSHLSIYFVYFILNVTTVSVVLEPSLRRITRSSRHWTRSCQSWFANVVGWNLSFGLDTVRAIFKGTKKLFNVLLSFHDHCRLLGAERSERLWNISQDADTWF